ncbi:cytochrome P450 [Frankia sp. R43]|uniref:cytochrome P450 n=1 Tax=Frankia sp. R43 TaxID=269536 RepID=UPI0006CA591D|nr:cytochrome P450 [Frankia sp. R43]KPM50942.1 cytochrome P450 [Frankia sp. R43]
MVDPYWDPFDKDIDVDPYPVWRRLRDEEPLYHNEKFGFYALSRHADVERAHRSPKLYSSAYGTLLEIMGPEPLQSNFMIFKDPPDHDTLRGLVSRAFTPRRVAALEGNVRKICADLLEPLVGSGGFDYIQDFAAQVPSRVISELIGVPEEDREEVRKTIDETFHIVEGGGMANDISRQATTRLREYFCEQIDARRTAPRDDMMTALVEAEVPTENGPRRLTTAEAGAVTNELVSAGTETVVRLLGWMCRLLAEHPDQRAELVADPSLVPGAVEESLRYEPPSPVQGRMLLDEVTLHDTTLPAGSKVLLLTGSAGRDERKYPDPDRYDIHRRFDSHVTLGHGIHFCLGASLARLEGRVAIEETLRLFPTWEVDTDRAVRLHTSTVRGYNNLPVVV